MQLTFLESLGWFLIIGGILLIFLAIILAISRSDDTATQVKSESKGIIFIGPIPIVWGYGRGSRIISIIGVSAIILFIIFFLIL